MIKKLADRGIEILPLTLHVGWGTFAPLPETDLESHLLHSEYYCIPLKTAQRIQSCLAAGKKVVACGTTAARALESAAQAPGRLGPLEGETRIFIRPGYIWKIVKALVTNFHLPRSSLLIMACAFGGRERILAAYEQARNLNYRFYSYGDAMLLL